MPAVMASNVDAHTAVNRFARSRRPHATSRIRHGDRILLVPVLTELEVPAGSQTRPPLRQAAQGLDRPQIGLPPHRVQVQAGPRGVRQRGKWLR
jgi:hypothetical protein